MICIAATEFKEHYGEYLEKALTEPLVIQKHRHNSLVLLSYKKFHELEESQERLKDMVLKLQMDKMKDTGDYIEGEEAVLRLKAYANK